MLIVAYENRFLLEAIIACGRMVLFFFLWLFFAQLGEKEPQEGIPKYYRSSAAPNA
jgi:hypothetical protein